MRVIDMECSVPKRATGEASAAVPAPPAAERPAGYGMANYERIFRSREGGGDARPKTELSAYVELMEKAGIVRAVPFGTTNDEVAELRREYPDRFIGLARISAFLGMRGVRELEQRVREQGFQALGVSALVDGIPASDRRFYPLYAKAAELGIPVRIYSSMNYATDRPYDLGHPRHLDQVAIDFPELVIVCGHVGYPWTEEMIAVARKHENVYIDTSAYTTKRLPAELVSFMKTHTGQRKVLFGTNYPMVDPGHVLTGIDQLGLSADAREDYLRGNAERVFGLRLRE